MSKAKQIIIDGKVINLTQEADSYFDENSENPVQNKVLHSKFNEIEGNFDDVDSAIKDIVDGTAPEIINILNPNDLLRGYTLATGIIIANARGIFSNKLYLEIDRTYILKNISLFIHASLNIDTAAIYIARYNSNDEFLDRLSVKPSVLPDDGYVTTEYTPTTTKSTNTTIANNTIAYYRILLQSGQNTKYPFDSTKAMIYDSKYKIDSFIPYGKTSLFYDRIQDTQIESLGNDISKIKNKLFPLEVTLSVSPSSAQEYTGANKDFIISWTTKIDGESVTPTALTLTVGGTVVTTDASKTSVTVAANDDRTINLSVEAEGRSATKSANINFARRYYSAVVDSTWTASNDTVTKLAKSALKNAKAATVTYSEAKQKKIVFAYPVSHDVMSTIQDAYGNHMFTLNDSGKTFNTAPKKVTVTLSGGATLEYYVYESVITNVVAGNITYTTKTFD